MPELLIAAWLTTATVQEMPGQPPLVLAVGTTVPETARWPELARSVACRSLSGDVLTYLLVWRAGERYEPPVPVAFHTETVSCPERAARR